MRNTNIVLLIVSSMYRTYKQISRYSGFLGDLPPLLNKILRYFTQQKNTTLAIQVIIYTTFEMFYNEN
jgi:hypothetical protein